MNEWLRVTRLKLLILLAIIPIAAAKQNAGSLDGPDPNIREYRPGQVWRTSLGPDATILKIEDDPKAGKIIHVRIDKVPIESCGGLRLTTSIEHIALTEKMMRKSVRDFVGNVVLPDSYFSAYREWEKQRKHKIMKNPMDDAIRSVTASPGPLICN